jgi:hypothetical protein
LYILPILYKFTKSGQAAVISVVVISFCCLLTWVQLCKLSSDTSLCIVQCKAAGIMGRRSKAKAKSACANSCQGAHILLGMVWMAPLLNPTHLLQTDLQTDASYTAGAGLEKKNSATLAT